MAKRIKREKRLELIRYQYRLDIDEVNRKIAEAKKSGNTEEVEKLKERVKIIYHTMKDMIAVNGGPKPMDW